MPPPRILFLHGLEGSPQGNKVRNLRASGFDVTAPALNPTAVVACLAAGEPVPQSAFTGPLESAVVALNEAAPNLLMGSSFGGGLAMELVHRGLWSGPLVLLAPAGRKLFGLAHLPGGRGRVLVAHGRQDAVVPVAHSVELAASTPGEVQLWLLDDDHRLDASVNSGLLGRLVRAAVE